MLTERKIVIFYAFSREIAAFRRRLDESRPLKRNGMRGFSGNIGTTEVALLATGMGTLRASLCARRAFSEFKDCSLVISCGVAGALSEGLSAGDIVLADRLLLGAKEGLRTAHILAIANDQLLSAKAALQFANIPFATGALLTSTRVLETPAAKRSAKQCSGAIAVDMESAALAIEAAAHGVP